MNANLAIFTQFVHMTLIYLFPLVIFCTCFWPPFWIPFWHRCDSVVMWLCFEFYQQFIEIPQESRCSLLSYPGVGGGEGVLQLNLNLPLRGITNNVHDCWGQRVISYQNHTWLLERIKIIFIHHIYIVLKLQNILKYYWYRIIENCSR